MEYFRPEVLVAQTMALSILSFVHSFISQILSESDGGLGLEYSSEPKPNLCPHGAHFPEGGDRNEISSGLGQWEEENCQGSGALRVREGKVSFKQGRQGRGVQIDTGKRGREPGRQGRVAEGKPARRP